jgi:hypothetical protein
MQTALVSYDQREDKLYLETFLIDSTETKKHRRVNEKTIDDMVKKSLGHPLTLYPHKNKEDKWIWGHPVLETADLQQNLDFQKKYSIGYAKKLKKIGEGSWNAVYEITNEAAKKVLKELKDQNIPIYTSSGIVHDSNEDLLDIKDWRIIHNSIVSDPANGFEKAEVKNWCSGNEITCAPLLTTAANDSKDNCGFCVANALEKYLSSLDVSSYIFPHISMSENSTQPTAQVSLTSTEQKPGGAPIPMNQNPTFNNLANPQDQPKQEEAKPAIDWEAKFKELQKHVETTSKAKEEEVKTVTERLATLERENIRNSRKAQVYGILQQYPEAFVNPKNGQINQEEYSKTVLEWIDKGYDDKTINELLEAKVIKAKNLLAGATKLQSQYASMTTASNEPSYQQTDMGDKKAPTSNIPIWEKVIDEVNLHIQSQAQRYQKSGELYK